MLSGAVRCWVCALASWLCSPSDDLSGSISPDFQFWNPFGHRPIPEWRGMKSEQSHRLQNTSPLCPHTGASRTRGGLEGEGNRVSNLSLLCVTSISNFESEPATGRRLSRIGRSRAETDAIRSHSTLLASSSSAGRQLLPCSDSYQTSSSWS